MDDRPSLTQRSEVRDGMRIDWDVPITMDDGIVLRAYVFRPHRDLTADAQGQPTTRTGAASSIDATSR